MIRKGDCLYDSKGNLISCAMPSNFEFDLEDKNPYMSPEETEEQIYDSSAPDGYYTILGGTAVFMLAIGFCIGVVTTVVFI